MACLVPGVGTAFQGMDLVGDKLFYCRVKAIFQGYRQMATDFDQALASPWVVGDSEC
jgi:hypothetical protein